MNIVSTDEIKRWEAAAAAAGTPSTVLMDNAGLAIARQIQGRYSLRDRPVIVLVGPGNNGGDGLVVARHLSKWRARVDVLLCAARDPRQVNLVAARDAGAAIVECDDEQRASGAMAERLTDRSIVVDALLGTGVTRPLSGAIAAALRPLLDSSATVVAVDVPSGLNSDTGAMDPVTPHATLTAALGAAKYGHFCYPGAVRLGELVVLDIGIPTGAATVPSATLLSKKMVASALPVRPGDSQKGANGRVLVIAGSGRYPGAPVLACLAAHRGGAGLVTLACPASIQPLVAPHVLETTYLPCPDGGAGHFTEESIELLAGEIGNHDVALVGPGLGQAPQAEAWLAALLPLLAPNVNSLVLDADALNIVSRRPDWWDGLPAKTVITPHPGEMGRLLGGDARSVQADRFGAVKQALDCFGLTTVLKGAHTIAGGPGGAGLRVSADSVPALATAGTGDILAGLMAALLAQGLPALEAAGAAVYLHAKAGQALAERLGDSGLLAGELAAEIPRIRRGLAT